MNDRPTLPPDLHAQAPDLVVNLGDLATGRFATATTIAVADTTPSASKIGM